MLTVIVGAVAGAIGALVALLVGVPPLAMVAAAAVAFVVVIALMQVWGRRAVTESPPSLEPRFRSPQEPRSA
jgi:membrane protein implicated in regulation of membrane protease activity